MTLTISPRVLPSNRLLVRTTAAVAPVLSACGYSTAVDPVLGLAVGGTAVALYFGTKQFGTAFTQSLHCATSAIVGGGALAMTGWTLAGFVSGDPLAWHKLAT